MANTLVADQEQNIATKTRGIGGHTLPNQGATDSWITPKAIIDALGPFDLDPCQCTPQPWPCATNALTIEDDGLMKPWHGRVWMNPPYSDAAKWLEKLANHGTGTALIFARTETEMFQAHCWMRATAMLFLWGRIFFHKPDGGPSVLVAYGRVDAERLRNCGLRGAFVSEWK